MTDAAARDALLACHLALTELLSSQNNKRPQWVWEQAQKARDDAQKWAENNNCNQEIERNLEQVYGPR